MTHRFVPMRLVRVACAIGLLGLGASSTSWAQPANAACAGSTRSTNFGTVCLSHAELPALTEYDYGAVHVRFTPPAADEAIQGRSLQGTWLRSFVERATSRSVRSAVVLLEVHAGGPDQQTPIANVPLLVYNFNNREGLQVERTQQFADRDIAARVPIRPGQMVRARVQVVFSREDSSVLVPTLTNVLGAATALTGGSFVLNALSSGLLNDNFNAVASSVRSAQTVSTTEDAWFDLNWESGDNTLTYTFQLAPRRRDAQPLSQGQLVLTLRRYPSLFTEDLLPGDPGRRLPDYGTQGRFDTGVTNRIWSNSYVAPGVSPEVYAQRAGLGANLRLLQSAETPIAAFEEVCETLRAHLAEGGVGLSPHDRAAVSWAAFVRGRSAHVRSFQDSHCIAQDRQSWADYGFTLPPTEPPRPPPPSPTVRDQWLVDIVIPALTDPNPNERYRRGMQLFAPNVLVNIQPSTLFADGREPQANTFMPREVLANMLEPLRIGCRFVREGSGAAATRFSVLGRRPDNNRLLTLTVDYQTRVGGASSVEVNGLAVAPTNEEDFAALAATPNVPARCLNREFAPSAAPTPEQ